MLIIYLIITEWFFSIYVSYNKLVKNDRSQGKKDWAQENNKVHLVTTVLKVITVRKLA